MQCISFGKKILAFKRISLDKKQTIICITNVSSKSQKVLLGNKENKYKNLLRNNISIIGKRLILKPFETVWLSNQKTKITIQYEDRPDTIVKITFLVKNPITKAVIAPNIFGSLIVTKVPKSSNKTPGKIIDGKTTDGT